MDFFYIGLIIGAILLALFMSYATYDYNLITSSYHIAMQQNEDNYNTDVEWIGPKQTTIFDDTVLSEIESAALFV